MRCAFTFCVALCSLSTLLVAGCNAENPVVVQQARATLNADAPKADSTPSKPAAVAKLDAAKKTAVVPLGKPAKPKFAMKMKSGMSGGAGANAPDRVAEVKRLIDAYHAVAIRYVDSLVLAKTPEEKAAVAEREPSVKSVRPFAVLLGHIIASDPKDEPALDALLFLSKYVGTPEIDAVLAENASDGSAFKIDPTALLLEHHADNIKVVNVLRTLPKGEATENFLQSLFDKSCNPKVRFAAGVQVIRALQRSGRNEDAEQLALEMSEDRYMEGVRAGSRNAREWAVAKLFELRFLVVGKELPNVFGNKLDGSVGQITDYRGKVLVLDVWATWCGPCRAMIPHETEMVERLKDKPFAFLSVSCDKERVTLEEFLEGTPMPWDHWWVGADGELKKTLNVSLFPSIFVLDAKGVIRYRNMKDEQLEEAVNTLLDEIEEPSAEPQS